MSEFYGENASRSLHRSSSSRPSMSLPAGGQNDDHQLLQYYLKERYNTHPASRCVSISCTSYCQRLQILPLSCIPHTLPRSQGTENSMTDQGIHFSISYAGFSTKSLSHIPGALKVNPGQISNFPLPGHHWRLFEENPKAFCHQTDSDMPYTPGYKDEKVCIQTSWGKSCHLQGKWRNADQKPADFLTCTAPF